MKRSPCGPPPLPSVPALFHGTASLSLSFAIASVKIAPCRFPLREHNGATMSLRLKERLRQGKPVRVFCLGQLCSPKLMEMIALHGGYDAVWLDQEHCALTLGQLEDATRAARATGMDTFVRLAPTDYATVMRPLEAGAGGIMAAQVRNARQTEEIVRWAKFHPRGIRGINNTGPDGRFGRVPLADYLRDANANTFIAIQIENVEALEDVERIAAVK